MQASHFLCHIQVNILCFVHKKLAGPQGPASFRYYPLLFIESVRLYMQIRGYCRVICNSVVYTYCKQPSYSTSGCQVSIYRAIDVMVNIANKMP